MIRHQPQIETPATTSEAVEIARWAEGNLRSLSFHCNRRIDKAEDQQAGIAIAAVGIAICRARRIVADAIANVEASTR